MRLAIGIARHPARPIRLRQADRRILDDAGQRITLRLGKRRKVDERLHQGSDRPARIQRTIESAAIDLAPTHQRQHLAIRHRGDHGCRLQSGAALAEILQ